MRISVRRWGVVVLLAASLCACNLRKEQARKEITSPNAAVRARALDTLAGSGDKAVLELAVPLLRDSSARVRRSAVAAVGSLDGASTHMEKLASRLRDGDLEVRLAAARVLGDSKNSGARNRLVPALEDPSVAVRTAAGRALEKLGMNPGQQTRALADHEVARQLVLLRVEDEQLRASAVEALGRAGQPSLTKKLLPLLKDAAPLVVREAARAGARAGGEGGQGALVALSRSKAPYDRSAAVSGLALLGTPAARARVIALLKDPSPEVRTSAVSGLGARGEQSAQASASLPGQVCPLLLDEDRRVAVEAARLVSARKLPCPDQLKVLAVADGEADGAEKLVVLSHLNGPAVDAILLISAKALYQQHKGEATRWVSARKWRELAGAAVDVKQPPPNKPGAKKAVSAGGKKALQRLIARFPERIPEDDLADPLLPPRVSSSAVEALIHGLAVRPAATAWLATLASAEGAGKIRVAALDALGRAPRASSEEALAARVRAAVEAGLGASALQVRRAAAAACPWLGKKGAARAMTLLEDPDFTLRSRAARCLGVLGHTPAVAPLIQRLGKERSVAIIQALAELGDHRATPVLVALLRQDHAADRQGERVTLVQALGKLAHPEGAAAALEQELTHPARQVRMAAARALATSGRSRSRKALATCTAGDYDAAVRAACKATLAALK